jgi:hypothetical protein
MLISSKSLVLLYQSSVDSPSECILNFYVNFKLQTVWSDGVLGTEFSLSSRGRMTLGVGAIF